MSNEKQPPFFMNYAEGQRAPTVKYATFQEAHEEAKRLARVLKIKVYTLQVVRAVVLSEFQETFYHADDLPF